MSAPDFSLLAKRRFAPLFVTQFLGAFNDNLFRTGLLLLATYTIYAQEPAKAELLATEAMGLFFLPYFLFSALAGQLADAWDKARLAQSVKVAEVAIMGLGLAGFATQSLPLLLVTLTLMGLHSTIFGPVKYSLMPQQLHANEIMGATGLIEAGTFLAILGGQLLGAVVVPQRAGELAMGVAVIGLIASLFILRAPPAADRPKVDLNVFRSSWRIVRAAYDNRPVWLASLGISWFFAVGAVLVGLFIPLVRGTLGGRAEVATIFLATFSVGVAFGSLIVNRMLRGQVSARYTPVAALLLAAGLIDLWLSTRSFAVVTPDATIGQFLSTPGSWRVLIDMIVVSVSGGIYIVPLYAVLQTRSPEGGTSQAVAANNILNSIVAVALVGAVTAMQGAGATVPAIIAMLGMVTVVVALAACWLLPETVIKWLVRRTLEVLYRVEVTGIENMPQPGQPAVVVVNHVSWLDGLLLAVFLPGKPTFAINTIVAKSWWVKPALKLFDAFPVDPTNPMAAKAMVRAVKEGRTLVIFPEGRITVTGALMKIFDGPGMVADKADAPIVPVRIGGAQYSSFSKLRGKVRLRMFPKITLTVLPPRRFELGSEGSARERRAAAGRKLYDVMSEAIFATSDIDRTLFDALLDARDVHGRQAKVIEDVKRAPMSYAGLLTGAAALSRPFAAVTRQGEAVGLLLPNVAGVVVAFFALQMRGRVPAMLNYTAGLANLEAATRAAQIGTIVTARAFVAQAKLGATIDALEAGGKRIVWLEDVGKSIGLGAKLRALLDRRLARGIHRRLKISPDSQAVILFTSGSEGLPKGVVLSHRNLLANCAQLSARIDFNNSDIVLNALPVFHSFGLTGGTLLPLLNGVKVMLYPSPLHYRIVPALAYDSNATILFGTDTFLSGYARMAHGYDFYSLRYIFAGAERVRDETRAKYAEKFGLRILEGYGATEAAPVIAVNTPMHFRAGSVGRLLPGIESKIDPVPGIETGGRLSIRGPNIMAGYMKADAPGVLQPPEDGWHDSGDIVEIDAEGFVHIRGRAKRFAKIGGEMVSLPAVEGYATQVWPGAEHAVVTRPDPRKGEQLVLLTTQKGATAAPLQAWAKANGVAELSVPRDIRVMDALPVLGTGKLDYVTMGQMAGAIAAGG